MRLSAVHVLWQSDRAMFSPSLAFFRTLKTVLFCFAWLAIAVTRLSGAEWQWSTPIGAGRAFLWIPPDCQRVRAVLLCQHNMLEEALLEHPKMRSSLARLGIAEVWMAPPNDYVFDFTRGAGEAFDSMMSSLAEMSGYSELKTAPAIPMGHSACASFPWNFGAWNPARTLAMISVLGDAPLTNLPGSGRPNPPWGNRTIQGVPGLMVMGEYEWLEERLSPALAFRRNNPDAAIAMLAEPGRGHFDASDELLDYLILFIRKCVEQRLTSEPTGGKAPTLAPINARNGWLVERWRLDTPRTIKPAPASEYTGKPDEAFWCFDSEMAEATWEFGRGQIGKAPQLLGFLQDGALVPQQPTHAQVHLLFDPHADGITFCLGATFLKEVESGSPNLTRWTRLPAGSPLGHATQGGSIKVSRITGPVRQVNHDTFQVQLNRTASTKDSRNLDVWILASHPGDARFKSAVQQALLHLQPNTRGSAQKIDFPPIADQPANAISVALRATSSSGLPVSYYVREGPAEVEGDTLRLTTIPPRARRPVSITVVAWQWGRSTEPAVNTATPVEQTFEIIR